MKKNKWVPRRETFTAKKLEEVHAEAEAELGIVSSKIAQDLPALPGQCLFGGPGNERGRAVCVVQQDFVGPSCTARCGPVWGCVSGVSTAADSHLHTQLFSLLAVAGQPPAAPSTELLFLHLTLLLNPCSLPPSSPSFPPPPTHTGQARAQADEFALLPPLRGGDLGWEYVGRKGASRNTFGPGSNSALVGDYRWAGGRVCVGESSSFPRGFGVWGLGLYVRSSWV